MSLMSAAISFGRRSFRLSKRRKKCVFDKLDSFVNSQEWTISRNVPDLRLGIVGSLSSGKSALVHRYLTDSYMQDESPEGGRFKKEVFVQGQSNMLLIRDEGGSPELQFSCWVDAVIFVFNVFSLESFETAKKFYQKFASYRTNLDQVPLILVGTQDPIGYSGQRIIDEYHARKLASEMHRNCVYYETRSLSGLNIDRVFQEACQRIIQTRGLSSSAPLFTQSSVVNNFTAGPYSIASRPTTPNSVNLCGVSSATTFHSSSMAGTAMITRDNLQQSNSSGNAAAGAGPSSTNNNNYLNNNYNSGGGVAAVGSSHASTLSTTNSSPGSRPSSVFGSLNPSLSSPPPLSSSFFNQSNGTSVSSYPATTCTVPHSPTGHEKSPSNTISRSPISLSSTQQQVTLRKIQPPQTTNNSGPKRLSLSAPSSVAKAQAPVPPLTPQMLVSGPTPPRRVESKQENNSSTSSNLVSGTLFTPISAIKEQLQQSSTNQNGLPIATTIPQVMPPQFAKDKQKENVPKDGPSTPLPATPQTPLATPNLNRKARRRSNLFPQLSSSKNKNLEEKCRNGELGSGRTIPLRQGYLHKKSVSSSLNTKLSLKNKEWKKKYVTLTTDGCLTYHPSLHDYMEDSHGKKINLMHTTVKIPGQRPRGSCSVMQPIPVVSTEVDGVRFSNAPAAFSNGEERSVDGPPSVGPISNLSGKCSNCGHAMDERRLPSTNPTLKDKEKKKHRRTKSGSVPIVGAKPLCERCSIELVNSNTSSVEEEDFVFVIVSLDNKQWHFQAASAEDRENWLQAIEQQILSSLQNMQSDKEKLRSNTAEEINNERAALDQVRQVAGNGFCLECDAPNPSWASLNLGALMCIECSGIHRNLGTHISKVRSLELDDWPQGHLSVMMALGNAAVNKIWEFNIKNRTKPVPASSRDEKEIWIRLKYEKKEFLCPLPVQPSIDKQLENAIRLGNIHQVALILGHLGICAGNNVELVFGEKKLTPLHLAAQAGSIPVAQLLIWQFSKLNAIDEDGHNALSYARSKEMQEFLKRQGCIQVSPRQTLTVKNLFFGKNSTTTSTGVISTLARRAQTNSLASSDMFDQLPASII